MAHDSQYKDPEPIAKVLRFDYPKAGESYWNKFTHRVEVAYRDLPVRFQIVEDKP